MNPRRLHSATILSIVTTSRLGGACSVILAGIVLEAPPRRFEVPGMAVVARMAVPSVCWRAAHKETALDISRLLCLHTLCSLADKTAEGTVLRPKGDKQSQERE